MHSKYSMKLKTIVDIHEMAIVHKATNYESVTISNYDVSRPSLQLIGFYDYFQRERIHVWGKSEQAFWLTLGEEKREEVLDRLFSERIPAMVVCHRVIPPTEMVEAARKYDVTLLSTDVDTSEVIAQLIGTLRKYLSPRATIHGVLVQVHGEGLLITGESGIGKSEVALELVKRGHRLVADDAVELHKRSRNVLDGCAPKMIRYLMELRGLGLVDIRRLYGVGSVLPICKIDLVVNFVRWDEGTEYDRMGLEDETVAYLGVTLPKVTIPVAPARNLAIILEVAAMNNRQKKLGYNTAKEFLKRHDGSLGKDDEDDDPELS